MSMSVGSCVAIAGWCPAVISDFIMRSYAASTSGFLLIGDALRLFVGALDQPDARAQGVEALARSCSLRYSADCSTTPICRWPCCHSVSKISSVTSVYGEFSMSMRTKNPAGSARSRIFRRLSTAHRLVDVEAELRQLQRQMPRPMPDFAMASMTARYARVADVGFVEVRHALAEKIERVQSSRAPRRRAQPRSPRRRVSPAMNRRAKLCGRRMP